MSVSKIIWPGLWANFYFVTCRCNNNSSFWKKRSFGWKKIILSKKLPVSNVESFLKSIFEFNPACQMVLHKKICSDNPRENNWNKVKKSSTNWHKLNILTSDFAFSLNALIKALFMNMSLGTNLFLKFFSNLFRFACKKPVLKHFEKFKNIMTRIIDCKWMCIICMRICWESESILKTCRWNLFIFKEAVFQGNFIR